ncbi:MAG: hypothetical protein WCH01_02330 [Methylococcaceae bacterium]
MPVYKSALTSDFTQTSNDLINDETMPAKAKLILMYLLSKPANWNLRVSDIKRRLNLGTHSIRQALKWLQQTCYIFYERLKTGHCIWKIFDKPQVTAETKAVHSPVIPPQVEKPKVENKPVLIKIKTAEINKPLPTPQMHESNRESIVVVDSELIYPEQLNPVQKKAAKHIIKKVQQPELQQPVLFALAYAIAQNKVKSAPAYLQGLVTRANNGTFEAIQPTTATNQASKPLIPIWQGFGQSSQSKPEVASRFIGQARAALRGIAI